MRVPRLLEKAIPLAGLAFFATASTGQILSGVPDFVKARRVPAEIRLLCVLVLGKTFRLEYSKSGESVKFSGGPVLPVTWIGFDGDELVIVASSAVYSLMARIGAEPHLVFGEAGAVPQRAECFVEK